MTDVLAARERCILFGIRSMGADETPYLVGFGGQRAEKKMCVCRCGMDSIDRRADVRSVQILDGSCRNC